MDIGEDTITREQLKYHLKMNKDIIDLYNLDEDTFENVLISAQF